MIDALLSGRVYGQPQERTSKSGKPFATCRMRIPTKDGAGVFASIIAFKPNACTILLALADGDAVTVAGELTPSAYTDKQGQPRPGLDVVAHQVLTAYHVKRKRDAMTATKKQAPALPVGDMDGMDDGPLDF